MLIKIVVFDQTWRLEESASFTEEWTGPLPQRKDCIALSGPDEFGIVKQRIWMPDGSLTLHVVRKEKETESSS
jgi:hypothetical protein